MKLTTLLVIVVLALSTAQASKASQGWNNWLWEFGTGSMLGVQPYATDGYDGSDTDPLMSDPVQITVHNAIFHENGVDGWTGPSGFYDRDIRQPFDTLGTQKTWLIYFWGDPNLDPECEWMIFGISRWFPMMPPTDYQFTLTLTHKPDGVVGGPDVGATWYPPTPLYIPTYIDLPAYRTDNGLTGYQFEFTATAVPEPSSILAFLCGLGGLAGFVVRGRNGGR